MNWNWPGKTGANGTEGLSERGIAADARLGAVKKACKLFRKSVDEWLKTRGDGSESELELRKRRTNEFACGETAASAVHALNEERPIISTSPLNLILERFANLQKTLGHMVAVNDTEISSFVHNCQLTNLLSEEVPHVAQVKKECEQLRRRQTQAHNSLEKEQKKLDKLTHQSEMELDTSLDADVISGQREKRDRLAHELEMLTKDVSQEQDKLTSMLLTLVSRENHYARSVVNIMRIQKDFYENAFRTLEAELPNLERILQETNLRPVFGEDIEEHLGASGRQIAFPIALAIQHLRDEDAVKDEGLFRISTKQIKLDKFKAYIDSQQDLSGLMSSEGDAHLYSALLKSYLRDLPRPLLAPGPYSYERWLRAIRGSVRDDEDDEDSDDLNRALRRVLKEELSVPICRNAHFVLGFLHDLSRESEVNKMTPYNLAIVLGPSLLWSQSDRKLADQANLESVIGVVTRLIEAFPVIFEDIVEMDEDELKEELNDLEAVLRSNCVNNNGQNHNTAGSGTPPQPRPRLSLLHQSGSGMTAAASAYASSSTSTSGSSQGFGKASLTSGSLRSPLMMNQRLRNITTKFNK